MGCLSLHFVTQCRFRSLKIKVLTIDGRCLKYDPPTIVKEVLVDFPSHVLFHSDTVRKLGNRARPLQRTLPLQPGHIYFLIPQPPSRSAHHTSLSAHTSSVNQVTDDACAFSGGKKQSCQKRRVSFAPTDSSRPALKTSVQVLPSPSNGVVRLKMVVSKQQLASMLEEGGDSAAMVEGLLSPLLRKAALSSAESHEVMKHCSWRPSLDSIPES